MSNFCCLDCSAELIAINESIPSTIRIVSQIALAFANVIKRDKCSRCGETKDLITELEDDEELWSKPN